MANRSQSYVLAGDQTAVVVDDDAGVYAIADGYGMGRSGETAASVLCETVRSLRHSLREPLDGDPDDPAVRAAALRVVQRVFDRAADQIYRLAERRPGCGGMAATGLVLVVGRAGAVLGHVGDTRAWLVHEEGVHRLTEEHHQRVGHTPTIRVDTMWLELARGDSIVFGTAGLYEKLDDDQIARLGRRPPKKPGRRGAGITIVVDPPDEGPLINTASRALAIQRISLFRHLTEPQLIRILKIVYDRELKRGDILFREGDPGDAIHILYSGALHVSSEGVRLTTLGQGSHLGEVAFMDGLGRSATVTAAEDAILLSIGRDDFQELIRSDPPLATRVLWALVLHLAWRMRSLTEQYAEVVDGR